MELLLIPQSQHVCISVEARALVMYVLCRLIKSARFNNTGSIYNGTIFSTDCVVIRSTPRRLAFVKRGESHHHQPSLGITGRFCLLLWNFVSVVYIDYYYTY